MLKKYNPEHNEYVNYIPLESYAEMKEEIDKLNERLKNTPVMENCHLMTSKPKSLI